MPFQTTAMVCNVVRELIIRAITCGSNNFMGPTGLVVVNCKCVAHTGHYSPSKSTPLYSHESMTDSDTLNKNL